MLEKSSLIFEYIAALFAGEEEAFLKERLAEVDESFRRLCEAQTPEEKILARAELLARQNALGGEGDGDRLAEIVKAAGEELGPVDLEEPLEGAKFARHHGGE